MFLCVYLCGAVLEALSCVGFVVLIGVFSLVWNCGRGAGGRGGCEVCIPLCVCLML